MKNSIGDILVNTAEQFENLQAIRGEKYAKAVKFVTSSASFAGGILGMASCKHQHEAMATLLAVYNTFAITNYCGAMGFTDEKSIDEITADGMRIADTIRHLTT